MSKKILRSLILAVCTMAVLSATLLLTGCPASIPEIPPAYLLQWGNYGPFELQFNMATGVAVDGAGNVYTTDSSNNRIQKFSSAGVFLATWGSYGTADGQMKFPSGIAVDTAGNVYVIDSNNYRIQKFSSAGVFLSKWGSYGTADGQFKKPRGIAVDAAGNVFVSDYTNNRIQKFTSAGAFLAKWGGSGSGNGQFSFVRGLAVDAAGNVYAADYSNNRIQKFSSTGAFLGKWGSSGTGDGQFKQPYGVAVDTAGKVYVTDHNNDRIQKFSSTGTFLAKWGSHGSGDGQFDEPWGIAVDTARNVYVVDGDHRIEKFGYPVPNSAAVNATLDGAPWSGPVSFTLTGPQTISGSSVSYTSAALAAGSYAITYNSGGPPNADFQGSTPAAPQILTSGGAITYTLKFKRQTKIVVNATLNGSPWTGPVSFNVHGYLDFMPLITSPTYAGSAVPQTLTNVAIGSWVMSDPDSSVSGYGAFYFMQYLSGGPSGATLFSITPGTQQALISGHTKTFTLNFRTEGLDSDTITVNAMLDGVPWSGPVSYNLQGLLSVYPITSSPTYVGISAPHVFANMPLGTWTIQDPVSLATGQGGFYITTYLSGGPPNATFVDITPSPWQTLIAGNTKTFTLNFRSKPIAAGTVIVNATLDGSPWTGAVNYALTGTSPVSGASVPQTSNNMPVGAYALAYTSGGPAGATLLSTTPSVSQSLTTGSTITYTLNFRTNKIDTGTLNIDALLDGVAWTGPLNFNIAGLLAFSGTSVTAPYSNVPVGSYTVAYASGGPPNATFVNIIPSSTQILAAGGAVTFTLNFRSKPVETGTINVNATMRQAAGIAPWTGTLSFTLTGTGLPAISGNSVDQTYTGVPIGSYTLTYVSGGPSGTALFSTTPSSIQTLGAGGAITFTMEFR